MMLEILEKAANENGLITAFAIVGLVMLLSGVISRKITFGRVQGSAIAILIGLGLAYIGGKMTGGTKGLADLAMFSGIGLMGGNMLRDFAIVATATDRKLVPYGALVATFHTGLGCLLGPSLLYFIVRAMVDN